MAFSSGTFSLYTPGNPTVTGTTISSDWANNTLNDIATGLSTCVLKDGSQTITANIPMSGFTLTGIAAADANGEPVRWQQSSAGVMTTTGDTLYASSANTPARLAIGAAGAIKMVASGLPSWLAIGTARQVPTVNAGATALAYANPITLSTQQASTSGTSIDFGSLPAGLRRITIQLVGVSTNGTSNRLFQIGTGGTPTTTTYLGSGGNGTTIANFTTGFGINSTSADDVAHGVIVLTLENVSTNTWTCAGTVGISNTANVFETAGSVSLAGVLDIVRCTTVNGTDAFDAGAINISYE